MPDSAENPGSTTTGVVILSEDHIHGAAVLMAAAFIDSPVYKHIFRGEKNYRQEALRWFFELNIRAMRRKDPSVLRGILCGDKVIATFFNTRQKLTMWEMVKGGLALVPFKLGIPTFLRLMSVSDWCDACEADYFSPKSSASSKLERLSVLPVWQGQGLGIQCIQSCLKEADEMNQQLTLGTQEERNMRLYSRLGFQVKGERYFEADSDYSFHSWFMSYK